MIGLKEESIIQYKMSALTILSYLCMKTNLSEKVLSSECYLVIYEKCNFDGCLINFSCS